MAASGITDELTALEQARSRLEAALSDDENWRALRHSDGPEDEGQENAAARHARNTRLEMALAGNPLYQAWTHLCEAIDALRESGASAGHAGSGNGSIAAASELPASIAELLHRNVAEDAAQAAAVASADPELEAAPSDRADIADGAADEEPKAGQSHPTPAPPPPASDVAKRPSPPPRGRVGAEPDEATVTFVRREPLLPSAQLPADLGTERASALFERLRGLSGERKPTEAAFTPPGGAEEAEVVIVTAESAKTLREAEVRAGTLRRLRKALSGY